MDIIQTTPPPLVDPLGQLLNREKPQRKTTQPTRATLMARLGSTAHAKLCEILEGYGNTLTDHHKDLLAGVVGTYALICYRNPKVLGRRIPFGLDTGLGKTSSIVAFVWALQELKLDFTLTVLASTTDDIIAIKDECLRQGVRDEMVGLLFSESAGRSSKANRGRHKSLTDEEAGRTQVLLINHARLTDARIATIKKNKFLKHRGRDRDLFIWDESLLRSDSRSIAFDKLDEQVKGLIDRTAPGGRWADSREAVEAAAYFKRCYRLLEEERDAQLDDPKRPVKTVELPPLPNKERREIERLLTELYAAGSLFTDQLKSLLSLTLGPVRVITARSKAVITYHLAVPNDLTNIVVLDGSWPIRKLAKLDTTFMDPNTFLTTNPDRVKRYDNVTVNFLRTSAGKGTLAKEYSSKTNRDERTRSHEIRDIIRHDIPKGEDVLILVHKVAAKALRADLKAFGIDLSKVHIETWGRHRASNSYAHCHYVILASAYNRADTEMMAAMVGQQDNITVTVEEDEIQDVLVSEAAHDVYQGISRSALRQVEVTNGKTQAKTTTIWLPFHQPSILDILKDRMPGVVVAEWKPRYLEELQDVGVGRRLLVEEIVGYVRGLPEGETKVSSRWLKRMMGKEDVHRNVWSEALSEALQALPEWTKNRRSIART